MQTQTKTFKAIYSDYAKADATLWAQQNGQKVVKITTEHEEADKDGFCGWVATLEYAVEETNAASQIVAACTAVFDAAWAEEAATMRSNYLLYTEAKAAHAADDVKNGKYSPKSTSTETYFYRALTGDSKGSPYMLKATASDNFKQKCSTMYRMDDKGVEQVIKALRNYFITGLTYKLRAALAKKQVETYAEATGINVSSGAKGYEISARIDGKYFRTDCVPAGGYNIQAFHYRYLIKF